MLGEVHMAFGKKKKNQRIPVSKAELQGDIETQSSVMEKAPFYVRFAFALKNRMYEIDPMRLALYIIGFFWILMFTILILLPFAGAIGEMPNKIPIAGGTTAAFLVWWFADLYHKHFTERVCVLSLEGRRIYVDNNNIDMLPKSERLYICNAYGNPIYNDENDDPRRYMQQKTISVPKEITEQFGSVRGMKALSYSDCNLTEVSMEEVDFSIFYLPRHISEERLIKENDRLKLAIAVANDIIIKLKKDMVAAVKNLRGSEKERLEGLIEQMSSLKQAFYGTPESLREMVRGEMYRPRWASRFGGGGYDQYYGGNQEYREPSWSRFSSRGQGSGGSEDEEETTPIGGED